MAKKDSYSVIFVTAANPAQARKIAYAVVRKKLAACANIINKIESVFFWKGKVERAREALLVLKARSSSFARLSREIKRLHSYDVLEIISLEIKKGEREYLKWIKSATLGLLLFFFGFSFAAPAAYSEARKICVLKSQEIEPYAVALDGFEAALKEYGYEEGKNLEISYFDMKEDPEEGKRLIEGIKSESPDLILTLGLEASKVARENVQDMPVVFSVVQEPVENGLVNSLASSGNNLTGSTIDIPMQIQLRTLRLFLPNLERVGLIYDPSVSQAKVYEAQLAAEALGVQLVLEPVTSYKDVPAALRSILDRIDALWLLPDPTVVTRQSLEYIFVRTLWSKKAVTGFGSYLASAGALFALGYDYRDVGRQSAELAARVLRGVLPSQLPITIPRKTELIINMKIARRLEIEVPQSVLRQAKEIIQ